MAAATRATGGVKLGQRGAPADEAAPQTPSSPRVAHEACETAARGAWLAAARRWVRGEHLLRAKWFERRILACIASRWRWPTPRGPTTTR